MSPGGELCSRSFLSCSSNSLSRCSVSSYIHPCLGKPRACAPWCTQGQSSSRNVGLGYHRFDLWRHQRSDLSAAPSAAESAPRSELNRCAPHLRRPHEGSWRSKARNRQRYNDPRHVLGWHHLRVHCGRCAVSLDPGMVSRGQPAKHLTPQSSGPRARGARPGR